MSVARFLTVSGPSSFAEYNVGGTTFAPIGDVTTLDGKHAEKRHVRTAPVDKLVEICAVCNDAKIAYNSVSLLLVSPVKLKLKRTPIRTRMLANRQKPP